MQRVRRLPLPQHHLLPHWHTHPHAHTVTHTPSLSTRTAKTISVSQAHVCPAPPFSFSLYMHPCYLLHYLPPLLPSPPLLAYFVTFGAWLGYVWLPFWLFTIQFQPQLHLQPLPPLYPQMPFHTWTFFICTLCAFFVCSKNANEIRCACTHKAKLNKNIWIRKENSKGKGNRGTGTSGG